MKLSKNIQIIKLVKINGTHRPYQKKYEGQALFFFSHKVTDWQENIDGCYDEYTDFDVLILKLDNEIYYVSNILNLNHYDFNDDASFQCSLNPKIPDYNQPFLIGRKMYKLKGYDIDDIVNEILKYKDFPELNKVRKALKFSLERDYL